MDRAALSASLLDGRLPEGTPLGDFVTAVDQATSSYPATYMVNCAHPTHLEPTLRAAADRGEPWLGRLRGLRANASAKTHAELDNSTELDCGIHARSRGAWPACNRPTACRSSAAAAAPTASICERLRPLVGDGSVLPPLRGIGYR